MVGVVGECRLCMLVLTRKRERELVAKQLLAKTTSLDRFIFHLPTGAFMTDKGLRVICLSIMDSNDERPWLVAQQKSWLWKALSVNNASLGVGANLSRVGLVHC